MVCVRQISIDFRLIDGVSWLWYSLCAVVYIFIFRQCTQPHTTSSCDGMWRTPSVVQNRRNGTIILSKFNAKHTKCRRYTHIFHSSRLLSINITHTHTRRQRRAHGNHSVSPPYQFYAVDFSHWTISFILSAHVRRAQAHCVCVWCG